MAVEGAGGLGMRLRELVGEAKPQLPFVAEFTEPLWAVNTGKKGKEQTQLAQRNAHENLATKWHGAEG